MSEIKDGGPAFPCDELHDQTPPYRHLLAHQGMSLRQYAAIKLRVPNSGDYWLDEMIHQAQRDEFAAKAMLGLIASPRPPVGGESEATAELYSALAYKIADAMLAAREAQS